MKNEFVEQLKGIEQELLALKTAAEYSSLRNSYSSSSLRVTTGLYRVDYATDGQAIMSQFYRQEIDKPCSVLGRTPSATSQIIEVDTTIWSNAEQRWITYENGLVIVSNVPITSITRIS